MLRPLQRELVGLAGGSPTFQWIEASTWKCKRPPLRVTPMTVRAESWLAVAGGARGLGFFPAGWDPAVTPGIAAVSKEVTALGAALLSPDAPASASGPMIAAARAAGGAAYVFAVNPTRSAVRDGLGPRARRAGARRRRGGAGGRLGGRLVRGRLRPTRRPPVRRRAGLNTFANGLTRRTPGAWSTSGLLRRLLVVVAAAALASVRARRDRSQRRRGYAYGTRGHAPNLAVRAGQAPAGFTGGAVTAADGESVNVYVEDPLVAADPNAVQHWADTLTSLLHGPEISTVTIYMATLDRIRQICGEGALGCYGNGRIAALGQDVDGVRAQSVLTHEYGHHIADSQTNDPWKAVDWGTKRWATYLNVCGRSQSGQLFPGDESSYYQLNPGEVFAEDYRVLNERRAGIAESTWQVVDQSLYPDQTALDLLTQDITQPWAGNVHDLPRRARCGGDRPGREGLDAARRELRGHADRAKDGEAEHEDRRSGNRQDSRNGAVRAPSAVDSDRGLRAAHDPGAGQARVGLGDVLPGRLASIAGFRGARRRRGDRRRTRRARPASMRRPAGGGSPTGGWWRSRTRRGASRAARRGAG